MKEHEVFFQKWEREAPKYDAVMDALPTDRLDYRPHPRSRSAAEMVTHLAHEQRMLVGMMDDGKIEYEDSKAEDFGKMRELWKKSTGELRDRLKKL
ncbi:MAG TPA: DinB family protein, partial [Thermoanaerobaculia bacterium]